MSSQKSSQTRDRTRTHRWKNDFDFQAKLFRQEQEERNSESRKSKKEKKSDILDECVGLVCTLELIEVYLALLGTFRMIRLSVSLVLRGQYRPVRAAQYTIEEN